MCATIAILLAVLAGAGTAIGVQTARDNAAETRIDGVTYVCLDEADNCPEPETLAAVAAVAREAFVGADLLSPRAAMRQLRGVRVVIRDGLLECAHRDQSVHPGVEWCYGLTVPGAWTDLSDIYPTDTWRYEVRLHLADAVWPGQREADDIAALTEAGLL